jgi:hypothetical protein
MGKGEINGVHMIRPCRRRPSRRVPRVELPGIELLDRRILPAVTAVLAAGTLRVTGDDQDNVITISRDAGGTILVNHGDVPIQGGTATIANTNHLHLVGAGGNDTISLDETGGSLPGADLLGGDGNDVLKGGSGDDFFDGDAGNDTILMGAGDDTFQWNPGDGSDSVDGQGGTDTMVFNGSDAAEKFEIADEGIGLPSHRVRFTRDVGNVTMDLDGVEVIDLNPFGGADTITVDDQSATDISEVNLDLSNSAGTADGETDIVVINGSELEDLFQVSSLSGRNHIGVSGTVPSVDISGTDGVTDQLTLSGQGGDDTLDAANLAAALIGLSMNGDAGNDSIIGSQGDDLASGGPGNDVVKLGDGRDTFVWNPGDGSDTVDGQGGSDRMVFNGSDASEQFGISAIGSRVRLTRDVGGVAMDLSGVETIDVNALGGSDTITVDDITATDLSEANLNLNNSEGVGDGQPDAVVVSGTDGDDKIQLLSSRSGTRIAVLGLIPLVNIVGAEGSNDTLTVNALGGNDTVDASGLPSDLIGLTVNLGDGQGTAATTTELSTSTESAVVGQTLLLTATVNSPAGAPTGTIAFLDGAMPVGSAPINAAGQATLLVSLGVGDHALTAVFAGNDDFSTSTSAVAAETVIRACSATALRASVNPALRGQTVTFTATVTAIAPGAGTPTGTVTLFDGAAFLGTAAVGADGRATFAASFATAGGHAITTIYSGDRNFKGSSQVVALEVTASSILATTKTDLAASARVVHKGQSVTFTAMIHAKPGARKPTGTVSFLAGDRVVARVRLSAAGRASFRHRFAAKGRFVIRAVYSGDTNFAASAQSIIARVGGRGKPAIGA